MSLSVLGPEDDPVPSSSDVSPDDVDIERYVIEFVGDYNYGKAMKKKNIQLCHGIQKGSYF